jgi:ribosome maturation factor RimP
MPGVPLDRALLSELEGVAEGHGCELLHAEFVAGVLRLILDRPEGVGLAECEAVSKEASAVLDVAEFGRGRYTLEVGSPGLDRLFYRPSDYERFVGRRVRVRFRDAQSGRPATVVATLAGYDPAAGEVDLSGTEAKGDLRLRLAQIEWTRLTLDVEGEATSKAKAKRKR